ncbi:MAG: energy-coupling factor transporter transmembrane protein EcfT, partial [bacterium]|nr:energy-coupling factor transporter transmembrane protein EcfT [bacterium]
MLDKIDPRLRIIICFFYSIFITIENDFNYVKYFAILPLFFMFFINDLKKFLRAFIKVNFFIFFCWFFLPFSIPGREVFKIFNFPVTFEGIKYTFFLTIKANFIFLTNFILIFSSHPFKIIHALHHLYFPKKLINILFLTTRYIPLVEREKNRIQRAMKMRCFRLQNNIHTYKTISNLVGVLILRSYMRGERIYKAMILRSFS